MEKPSRCCGRRCKYAYRTTDPKITEKIRLRMIVVTFNSKPSATFIFYSPTNTFYKELSSLVRSIPKHNVLVIGEDMDTQTGKNVNSKFSFYNSLRQNGEHLTDFRLENRLTCLNTKFQKSENYANTPTKIILKHR